MQGSFRELKPWGHKSPVLNGGGILSHNFKAIWQEGHKVSHTIRMFKRVGLVLNRH
jgi:hypothetical protein